MNVLIPVKIKISLLFTLKGNPTYFDIASREILFAVEASGKAGGAGLTKHWVEGVNSAFRDIFIDEIYKPKRTDNFQINSKLLFC